MGTNHMTLLTPNPTTAPSVASGMVSYGHPMLESSPYITLSRHVTIEASGAAPPWLGDLERRINQLLALGPNWDTYGAQPIRLDHVLEVLRLLAALVDGDSPMPTIVPTAARGMQVEWHTEHAAVEARAGDDGVHIYVEDDAGKTEGVVSPQLVSRAASALAPAAPAT